MGRVISMVISYLFVLGDSFLLYNLFFKRFTFSVLATFGRCVVNFIFGGLVSVGPKSGIVM